MRASRNWRVCSVSSASSARALQPRRQPRTLVARLFELARQVVDAAAVGARVDDAEQQIARRQRGARIADGLAGLHFAFDRRAQGDDARVDDRLDARGLRHALQRLVTDRGDESEPEQRLDDAPRRRRGRLLLGRRDGRRRFDVRRRRGLRRVAPPPVVGSGGVRIPRGGEQAAQMSEPLAGVHLGEGRSFGRRAVAARLAPRLFGARIGLDRLALGRRQCAHKRGSWHSRPRAGRSSETETSIVVMTTATPERENPDLLPLERLELSTICLWKMN
jgi:hypothetical protein